MIFTEPMTINYEQRLQYWIESDHLNDGVDLFPHSMKIVSKNKNTEITSHFRSCPLQFLPPTSVFALDHAN